jgi:catechol 2,3-dioxygenase-like lactoylglutathione lyase family enzyme
MPKLSVLPQFVHHVTLTVTDVARSHQFYSEVLGFQLVRQVPPRVLLHNQKIYLSLTPAQLEKTDRFDEHRVGLDHLSFRVSSRRKMERALALFEQHAIIHGEIKDMRPLPIYVLAFRDPDNIQLELIAMYELPLLIKYLFKRVLRQQSAKPA